MKSLRKKYLKFILVVVGLASPILIFLYETKKLAGIKDLFDVEDDYEL